MKRSISSIILCFTILCFVSCGPKKQNKEYVVQFDSAGGTIVSSQTIEDGKSLIRPTDPTKEGDTFAGWYLGENEFDFKQEITENLTLVAKWNGDGVTGYYESMNGHLDATFKATLHQILKSTHTKQLTYSEVWGALKQADKDSKNEENILCIYTGKSISIAHQDKGSAGNNIWNREHAWPNSHSFSSKDYAAYTDIHHLFASEKNINATRGNNDFNNVFNGNSDSYGNKWDNTFFEPRDAVKGDLARAMFYMVVRYDDPSELDLELSETSTTSSSNKTGKLGILSVLLEWNIKDLVSAEERARNEIVYSIQGNRNPFVDYPEWINYLYPTA